MKLTILLHLLLLVYLPAFAADCTKLFQGTTENGASIEYLLDKSSVSDQVKIQLLNLSDKEENIAVQFLRQQSIHDFKKTLRLFEKKPELFERFGQFDYKKFLLETKKSGYLKAAKARIKSYKKLKKSEWQMPSIINLPAEEQKDFEALKSVFNFLDDSEKVFARMQEFEDAVLVEALLVNPNLFRLDETEKAKIVEASLVKVLEDEEIAHGFISANKNGPYKAFDLEERIYSIPEWNQLLQDGKIFNDTAFQSENGVITDELRKGHGYFTHRIQWHLVMKEMNSNPEKFHQFTAVQLFKKNGDAVFEKKLGMGDTGPNSLWGRLFDSHSGTYHQPEVFHEIHLDCPELGPWL